MRLARYLPLLLLVAAKSDARIVLNHARLLAEPKYWSRHVGDVDRGDKLTVVKEEGDWVKVKRQGIEGYVPKSAFQDTAVAALHFSEDPPTQASAAQASNASRGFSKEANAQDVSQAGLKAADAWVDKYQGAQNGKKLEDALADRMPAFISQGKLEGAP